MHFVNKKNHSNPLVRLHGRVESFKATNPPYLWKMHPEMNDISSLLNILNLKGSTPEIDDLVSEYRAICGDVPVGGAPGVQSSNAPIQEGEVHSSG